jgi:hypothetical protein
MMGPRGMFYRPWPLYAFQARRLLLFSGAPEPMLVRFLCGTMTFLFSASFLAIVLILRRFTRIFHGFMGARQGNTELFMSSGMPQLSARNHRPPARRRGVASGNLNARQSL